MARKNDSLNKGNGSTSDEGLKRKSPLRKADSTAKKLPIKAKSTPAKRLAQSVGIEAAKKTPSTPVAAVSEAEVALRAYLIYEERRKLGTPGDHHGDWAQAVRELSAAPKAKRTR